MKKDLEQNRKQEVKQYLKNKYLLHWADDNIFTPKGEKLDWYDHQYLIGIYKDASQNMVIKKGAQIGITTYAMIRALWFADTNNVSIIYTFPTASDVSDFSRARINPMIQASPHLTRIISGEVDSVGLKQLGNSFVYFRGAWSERQAIAVDSDFNIHDETDFSKPNIIEMYKERMSHSKHKFFLALSTPTIPEFGIDYLFERSDKKEWFIKCPKCKEKQILKYPDSIKGNTKEARYACVHCLATITDDARRQGEWVVTGDEDWGVSGYHITQMMAPWISATDILRKEESSRIRPTAQLSGIKDFYNFCLGEAYGGENQPLNRDLLLSCIQNKYEIQPSARNTIMGVDQGDINHIVIWVKEREGGVRLVYVGTSTNLEKDVPNLIDAYGVRFCLIDAMPYKNTARKLSAMYPAKVWLVYYSSSQKEAVKWYKDSEKKEYRVIANKMDTLDSMADKFVTGDAVLPRLSSEVDLLIRHLCNWAKDKEEKADGRVVWVYKKLGSDHLTMATNYAMLGLDRLSTGSLAEPDAKDIPKKDRPITSGIMDKVF